MFSGRRTRLKYFCTAVRCCRDWDVERIIDIPATSTELCLFVDKRFLYFVLGEGGGRVPVFLAELAGPSE